LGNFLATTGGFPCRGHGDGIPQAAWAHAEQLSIASGAPWKDRHGVQHQTEDKSLVGQALTVYASRAGHALPYQAGHVALV